MILAKIYLDNTPKGRALVIEASRNEGKNSIYLSLAKKIYDKSGRLRYTESHTTIVGRDSVAISPEAKAALLACLDTAIPSDVCDIMIKDEETAEYGTHDPASFAFLPQETDPATRVFNLDTPIVIKIRGNIRLLDTLPLIDNDTLRHLALN